MKLSLLNLTGKRRLPLIRQTDAAECGIASLAMVANYYGYQIDLNTLRRKYPVSIQGMSLRSVIDTANKIGFDTRPIRCSMSEIKNIRLPAILHWNMNHFVVLKSIGKNSAIILDPAMGERKLDFNQLSQHFTGIALELTPSEKFEQKKEINKLKISDLWPRFFNVKKSIVQAIILSVMLQVFILASPFYLQIVVDDLLTKYDTDLLVVLAIGFAGFTIINFVVQLLRGFILLYFGSMLSFQMVGNLFKHLIRLPINFFEKRHIGDISSRFCSMEPVKAMLTEGLIAGIIDGFMAISTLTLMIVYSFKLAMIVFFAWLLYLLLRIAFYKPLRYAEETHIADKAKEHTVFIESVRGISALKLFSGERKREGIWQNKYADVINSSAKNEKLKIWFESANTVLFGLEYVVLIYVAANMVMNGEFSIGMIFAFMAYKQNFSEKASGLVEKLIEYRMLSLHLERVSDIAHSKTEDLDESDHREDIIIDGDIELQNINYRYSETTPQILKNVNCKIKSGEAIAITGLSGGGKTTLFKIMTTLFEQNSGEMLIDGKSLSKIGLTNYRDNIGVVMQDDRIFAGTLADNISFFDPHADMERVQEVAKIALIHDEIMSFTMKYETLSGDMGSALSGGQLQRLLLARALYKQPKILFMDEGTAHLDVETERKVNDSIAKLGMTRIIIAHRPNTIKMADRILHLENGTFVG